MADFLTSTSIALTDPLIALWNSFVAKVPGIVGALLLLLLGYIVSFVIGHAVRVILEKAGLDKQMQKAEVWKAVGHTRVSAVFGELLKWFIFIVFLEAAVEAIDLGTVSLLLAQLVVWLPNLIAAILVLFVGLFLSHYVAFKIEQHTEIKGSKLFSGILKVVIWFMIAIIALGQIGINVQILENTFLILLAGASLAMGLSFGLGTKADAARGLKSLKKML